MTPRRRRGTARHKPPLSFYRLAKPAQRGQRDLVSALVGIGRIQHRRHIAGMHRVDTDTQGAIASSGSARRSRGSMRSGKSWLGSSANWRRPSVCWLAIAQARRERSRPSRPLHRSRQLLQPSGNAAAGLLRPRNQVTVVAPRQPSAIRCLPWQPAERSTKSLPLVRGLARTMSARPSPGTSGQAASKSATGSYTQAKRQRRRNTQRSDSAVNGRSRSSVTADRQVELTAAVSLAATTVRHLVAATILCHCQTGERDEAAIPHEYRQDKGDQRWQGLSNLTWIVSLSSSTEFCRWSLQASSTTRTTPL